MILGEELNQWGEPITPKFKPVVVEKRKPEPEPESFILEDVYMTLQFLSEVVDPEPSLEEQKETILKKARIARENYKFAQEEFLHHMESIGVSRDEARVLWADADT